MDVSIVFVNWNSTAYLRESIASIKRHTAGLTYEIIVVDNASPVRDVYVLKEEFPEIVLLESDKNLGFAGANNLGAGIAAGKYLLFLNPDTELRNPAINFFFRFLETTPNAGIVGAKLLNSDGSIQTSCIQRFPTILNQMFDFEALRVRWPNCPLWSIGPLFSDTPKPASVEVISGACMMLRSVIFRRVGYFSTAYFMYAEDLDLCYKVLRSGHPNYYLGEAVVVHHGGKSSVPAAATVRKWKSILQYVQKHRGKPYGWAFRMAMAAAAAARIVLIKLLGIIERDAKSMAGEYSASEKWQAVLRTLLNAPKASQSASTR